MPPISSPEDTAPDLAAAPDAMGSAAEQPVPLAALSLDGTPPGEGDDVTFTITGKVARIEGEMAIIVPSAINDQPISAAAAEPDADDAMKMARDADKADDMGY